MHFYLGEAKLVSQWMSQASQLLFESTQRPPVDLFRGAKNDAAMRSKSSQKSQFEKSFRTPENLRNTKLSAETTCMELGDVDM